MTIPRALVSTLERPREHLLRAAGTAVGYPCAVVFIALVQGDLQHERLPQMRRGVL